MDLSEESGEDGVDSNIYAEQAQTLLQLDVSTSEEAAKESAESTSNQIEVILRQRSELEILLIPPEEGNSSVELPRFVINGWGFGQGQAFRVSFQASEPDRAFDTSTISDNENVLTLDFAQHPSLVSTLRKDWGGVFEVKVTENQQVDIPVLILSRPRIVSVSMAPQ